jgi:prolyl oligopeptidase
MGMNPLRAGAFLCAMALGVVPAWSQAPLQADPYQYLEDAADPRTQAFFRDEAARAREALDLIPGRKAMLARIRALSAAETTVTSVKLGGTRVFYLKQAAGQPGVALYMREGLGGAERLLFDPYSSARAAHPLAIEGFSPSPDGRHVAFGLAEGGAAAATLRVIAVEAGRALPFEIDRARATDDIAWHPDGRSFFYARAPEGGARRFAGVRLYRHVLGRATERDEIVFAPGVGGARDVPESGSAALHLPLESRFVYALTREGLGRDAVVHVAELHDLAAARPQWRRLAGADDGVLDIEAYRTELYVLSRLKSPRHRVLRVRGDARDMSAARVVVPEGESVIEAMALARDALYLRTMVGGVDRLERVPLGLLGAKPPEYVRIPFDNAISQLVAHPRAEGVILRLQGWIEPPAIVQIDRKGDLRRTALQPPAAANYGEMDEVRLYAPGHDGVKIPVTLVYRKATRLGGDNPTLLTVYGAHGLTIAPEFDPAQLAWLERGGVLAIAHVRGGGEFGQPWREAGRRGMRANTVLDVIAAAQFLASYGFTSPGRLAVQGTGAGAIAAAGAGIRRPELFAAIVARAAMLDMVRAEQGANGRASVAEFGSAATAEGSEALRAISAYHLVRDGGAYPAMLLSVGANDGYVDAWHAAKMAARLRAANALPRPVLLRVDYEAGHPPAASRAQRDEELADIYAFALWQMGEPGFQLPPPPPPPAPPAEPAPALVAPALVAPAVSSDPDNPNPERPQPR